MGNKYSWRKGFSYSTPADIVGETLEKIENRDGNITAKSFLDESRPEDIPTHSMFEWNDTIAAEKYRLSQSTKIINQLEITVEDVGEAYTGFVNIEIKSPTETAEFVNIGKALTDEEYRHRVLANALGELKAFKRKYGRYTELCDIFNSIERYERSVVNG